MFEKQVEKVLFVGKEVRYRVDKPWERQKLQASGFEVRDVNDPDVLVSSADDAFDIAMAAKMRFEGRT